MNNWLEGIWIRLKLDRRMAAPLVLAAMLRLGLMVVAFLLTGTQVMMQGDTASYLEPGKNLILHGAFATAGAPEIDRTPGYPVFAMLTGMAFGVPMAAFSATRDKDTAFITLYRFVVVPLFLFSGTFFPISQLPLALQYLAYVTPLFHGVALCRDLTLGQVHLWVDLGHAAYLALWVGVGYAAGRRTFAGRGACTCRRARTGNPFAAGNSRAGCGPDTSATRRRSGGGARLSGARCRSGRLYGRFSRRRSRS